MSEPENRNPVERKSDGKFAGSGNPGGRPKGYADFRAKCREHSDAAIARLVEALADDKLCVQAAQTLLAYGWGKPSSAPEDNDALKGLNPFEGMTPEELAAYLKARREARERG